MKPKTLYNEIEQIEKLSAILTNELKSVCYKGPSGTRWHDVGLKDKFKKAMNYVLIHYANVELQEVSLMLSSQGTQGNIANSNSCWTIKAIIHDKECIFKGNWNQLGMLEPSQEDIENAEKEQSFSLEEIKSAFEENGLSAEEQLIMEQMLNDAERESREA